MNYEFKNLRHSEFVRYPLIWWSSLNFQLIQSIENVQIATFTENPFKTLWTIWQRLIKNWVLRRRRFKESIPKETFPSYREMIFSCNHKFLDILDWNRKERAESLYFSARAALRNSGGSNGKENAGNSGIIGIDDGENFANLQHFNPEHLAPTSF